MQIVAAELKEKRRVLSQSSYFATLNHAILNRLAQATTLRSYQRGEVICWQGEPCLGLSIIQEGRVKLFKLSPKGRELIIRIFDNGATFNEVPVFDYGPNPVNVAALEDSLIWVVDADAIRKCMQMHPEMAQAVIQNLSANLRMLVDVVEELSFYQVTNRLARLIISMPPEQKDQHITQNQLAARLGTVREVVARSLRDLERSGAIQVQHRQIHVLDEHILHDWAQEPER